MRLNPFRKRRRVKPLNKPKKEYKNPFFSKENFLDIFIRKIKVHYGFFILIFFALGYLIFFSEVFQIQFIKVHGAQKTKAGSIEQMVKQELAKDRFLVFSQKNFFMFNDEKAERLLKEQIQKETGLDQFTLKKKFPRTVKITLKEIIPSITWQRKDNYFYINREGVVAQDVKKEKINPAFPLIYDVNEFYISPGDKVINNDILSHLEKIKKSLNTIGLEIERFETPVMTCPLIPQNETNTNNNTNSDSQTNNNTNNSKLNLNLNKNTNSIYSQDCLEQEKLKKTNYINVLTTKEYLIYFDVSEDINSQINLLNTVLKTELKGQEENLKYIDLRFGRRIYYQ
ncbi:MAG: hypothetical protein U5L76_02020 [Patescibacteria group bacterium]|nr:hypothetical protein [Patescibacteria group bacterium]